MGARLAGDYVTLIDQCFVFLRARLYNYDCKKALTFDKKETGSKPQYSPRRLYTHTHTLHKANLNERAAVAKTLIIDTSAKM